MPDLGSGAFERVGSIPTLGTCSLKRSVESETPVGFSGNRRNSPLDTRVNSGKHRGNTQGR